MSTILLVEDSAVCREPIALALRAQGYKVICAADGQDGLDALAKGFPDLIILDLGMPRVDGLTFLAHLRNNPQGKAVPVLVFTAATETQAVLRAKALGAREFLLKSRSSLSDIIDRVRKHLGEKGDRAITPSKPASTSTSAAAPAGGKGGLAARKVGDDGRVPSATGPIRVGPTTAENAAQITCDIPRLLDRQMTINRIESCGEAKTLAGVVIQVLALCRSTESSLKDLADVLSQDALLATRVLQVANSAAFASGNARAKACSFTA